MFDTIDDFSNDPQELQLLELGPRIATAVAIMLALPIAYAIAGLLNRTFLIFRKQGLMEGLDIKQLIFWTRHYYQ